MDDDYRWYESERKPIQRRKRINVTKKGQELALEAAHRRNENAGNHHLRDRFGLNSVLSLKMHHIGTLGEAAMREYLELDLAPMMEILSPQELRRNPTIKPNVWVRSTEGLTRRLYLREDDKKHPEGLIVFAPIGSLDDGFVVFAGWVYSKEGTKPEYWQQVRADRNPQFYVPSKKLEPYGTFLDVWKKNEQPELF